MFEKIISLLKYFITVNQLINIYLTDLSKYLDNNNIIDLINNALFDLNDMNIKINKTTKQLANTTKFEKNVSVLDLFRDINNIFNDYTIIFDVIHKINIFDEKTLISDTSKHNLNNNKNVIIDAFNKIKKKLKHRNYDLIEFYKTNFFKLDPIEHYLFLHDYYKKNTTILHFYINIVKEMNSINPILDEIIKYNIINDSNDILINNNSELLTNNISNFYYLFSNTNNIVKFSPIIQKFNNFSSYAKFTNLQDIFLNLYNFNFEFKSNDLNSKTFSTIQFIINDIFKVDNELINISIIHTAIEDINYNINNLTNSNYEIPKDSGINVSYINKTKTIINKFEYSNLITTDNNYINEFYISKFDSIININNFNSINNKTITQKNNTLFNSKFIILVKLQIDNHNSEFHILKYKHNTTPYMTLNNVKHLLQNLPTYYTENLNILKNNTLISHINNTSLLHSFNSTIANDFKNIKKIDNLELKNNIVNKIKNNATINKNINNKKSDYELKNNTISLILNIIQDELYSYIQHNNNIDFSPEIKLTFYSNINSMFIKVKKELNDNYDSNLIDNIETILNNIYSNIITINYNILDKYYLTKL